MLNYDIILCCSPCAKILLHKKCVCKQPWSVIAWMHAQEIEFLEMTYILDKI